MNRRLFIIAAASLLASCATPRATEAPRFESDRISVTASGSGPDVLLVPGLGSSPQVWDGLIQGLPGYRYHLVQLNGFAGTPVGGNAEGAVIAPATEEIARYIRESGLNRPAIIGHSMGGTVVLGLASRHDLVSKAMVVDMLPFLGVLFGPPGTTAESVRATADALRTASLAATPEAREQTVRTNISSMVREGALRDQAIGHALASDRQVVANAYHELIVTDLRPQLANIRVPLTVLYVPAPAVPITPEQWDALYMASYAPVPQVQLKRIPDSLHFIMYDQPQRFAQEVKAFLG
jgi:pimeloyl-ACP methyl ester carboxylesterase